MRLSQSILIGSLILASLPPTALEAEDFILYTPKAVESGNLPAGPEEGVLVQHVTIRKGDTLRALARKYRGRSSYFPQFLIFNKISNPDLILAGSDLLVPVGKSSSKATRKGNLSKRQKSKAPVIPTPESQVKTGDSVPLAADQVRRGESDRSRQQYNDAVSAYNKGRYLQALEIFNLFLARFPNSPLAADATLYRADCLLNLSRQ